MINLEREEGGRFNGKQTQTCRPPPPSDGRSSLADCQEVVAKIKTDVSSEVW